MKKNGLTVRPRRCFIATTDSNHNGPIFPDLAKSIVPTNVNQLWVADINYIAIAAGFVYLAAILDAWSRRVVGYAIGKRIDARLALAALRAAIAARRPPPGCIHHSDRGSQYAAEDYRAELVKHGLSGRWVDAATHTTTPRLKLTSLRTTRSVLGDRTRTPDQGWILLPFFNCVARL